MKQLKISLPDDLRAKLDEAAALSGNSVAEEIRQRVEKTFSFAFAQLNADEETRALVDAVYWLTWHVESDMGARWHQHLQVRRALLDAVSEYMLAHQQNDTVEISADAKEGAGTIGRAFARAYLQIEQERFQRREGES
jgi:hypothetical protein